MMDRETLARYRSLLRTPLAENLAARVGALVALTVASIIIARTAGPAGLGTLTLLRLFPWLVGLALSGGIYAAAPYFLAGARAADSRYRATLPAMAVIAGAAGSTVWLALTPVVHHFLLKDLSTGLVAFSAVTVTSQLIETSAKSCSQGFADLRGAHRLMVLEEAVFIPTYLVLRALHVSEMAAVTFALPMGDVLVATSAWVRLARRGFFRGTHGPSIWHARQIARYGFRASLGSVMTTVNARLDFALVAALMGPVPLGVYAVASRYAELLRLPYLALNYVLYPEYARADDVEAATRAKRALARSAWVPAALICPMAIAAPIAIPLVFGHQFHGAIVPACVILVGLAGGGVNGVVTAYFSGVGRPGLNSLSTGAGLAVGAVLYLSLIPPFGIIGAASASTAAYLVVTIALYVAFRRVTAKPSSPAASRSVQSPPVVEVAT